MNDALLPPPLYSFMAWTGKNLPFAFFNGYLRKKLRGLSPRGDYTDRAAAALSAKLVPTFADRGVSRGQRNGSPRPLVSVFWTGAATFLFK